MENALTSGWDGIRPLTPILLSEIVKSWDSLNIDNKLGAIYSLFSVNYKIKFYPKDIFQNLILKLERDEDPDINTFSPLVKNWFNGFPLCHDLPRDNEILNVAEALSKKLIGIGLSFRTKDHIYFPPSTQGLPDNKEPTPPPENINFDIYFEAVSWEESWAYTDPLLKSKGVVPEKLYRGGQLKLPKKSLPRSTFASFTKVKLRKQVGTSRFMNFNTPSYKSSKACNSTLLRAISNDSIGLVPQKKFQPYTRPEPKVELIPPSQTSSFLSAIEKELKQAKIDDKKQRLEQKEVLRQKSKLFSHKAKELGHKTDTADKVQKQRDQRGMPNPVRGSCSKSARTSQCPPRQRFLKPSCASVRPQERPGFDALGDFSSDFDFFDESHPGTYFTPGRQASLPTRNKSLILAPLSSGPKTPRVARTRLLSPVDSRPKIPGGKCLIDTSKTSLVPTRNPSSILEPLTPKAIQSSPRSPTLDSRPENPRVPTRHSSPILEPLSSKLNSPIGINSDPSSPILETSPKTSRDISRPLVPFQMAQVTKESGEIEKMLSSSNRLHPNDLNFIRQCLQGIYVKPKRLVGDFYVVLIHEKLVKTGGLNQNELTFFEVQFLSDGQGSHDIVTHGLDPV